MKHSDPLNNKINQAIDDIKISTDELNQLTQARERALTKPKNNFIRIFSTTVVAYASVFLVVGIIISSLLNIPSDLPSTTPQFQEEFSFLSNQDSVKMYEDLEFYMWLDIAEPETNEG